MTSETSAVPKPLEKTDYQRVNSINYLTLGFTDNVAKCQETIQSLPVRDDDIFVVGFPRTGNHWIQEILSMILKQDVTFNSPLIYQMILETQGPNMLEKLEKLPSPRTLFTHYHITRLPSEAVEKRVKIIGLIRNPKDTLVSLYRLMSNWKTDNSSFKGTWNEFFELQMKGEVPYGPCLDHFLDIEKFMKEHPECPVYVNSFESIKLDPVTGIKNLCTFLGKPVDLAEDIAKATEYKNMKDVLFAGKLQRELDLFQGDSGRSALFNKGIIGGWRDYFTVAQNERFDKYFEEKMAGSKIADLIREYI